MTDLLHTLLLWTGIGLALLASVVVAPDALPRLLRKIRAVAYRYLPFLRPGQDARVAVGTSTSAGWAVAGAARGESWDDNSSVEDRIRSLRNQVIELRELVATTREALRTELNQKIGDVTAQLEAVQADVAALRSAFTEAEERSSDLDARGLPPIGFGILLSGAPAELASVPLLGWGLATVGVGLVTWCIVVLVKHYGAALRQRAACRTATTTAATGTS